MIIDTHCHLDLYHDPISILNNCENRGIITISMTNLPSHFELGLKYFENKKKVRNALGFHPLHSQSFEVEYPKFVNNIDRTSYIGEIGLDFSSFGKNSKSIQVIYFTKIIELISTKKKIISIHSRKAEKEVLEILKKYNIQNAIFHWYSGSVETLKLIKDQGYFFSININMINSANGKKIIDNIPRELLLTESDGPFTKINNRLSKPWDIENIHNYLSNKWNISNEAVAEIIRSNFFTLVKNQL